MSPALPRADLDALMSVVSRLREVAARLRDASSSDADVQSIATEASLLFLDLKAANREVLESAEETREATAAAKAALDGARLRLQNVLYEKAHIQKEIRANQDFRSAFTDEEIGLCSVDEFRRKAPEETRKGLDEHELMLKRLSHELTERKALCERERSLEARVKTLKDGIRRRRTFMDGLGAQLKSLKRASLPLQTHLELPFALAERRTRAARALPPPLYVLYTQLAAAKEAFAEDIDVSIEGSIADAEAFARREAAAREKKEKASERGDGGVSGGVVSGSKLEDGDDEDGERTRKRARTFTGAGEDGDDPYATHPLAVVLVVGSGSATCTFRHHVALRVVSCETRASLDADLLVNLFPDDDGEESPNAANALRWRGFRWDADGRRRERPFRWCQHLAGVDFLPAAPRAGLAEAVHEGVATHQRQARVRHVLAAIRARITSRAKLKSQLGALARRDVDALAAARRLEMRPKCALTSWRETTNVREGDDEPASTRATGPGTGTGPGSDTATRTVSVTARRFRATFRASNRRGAGGGDGVDIVADVVVPAEFPRKPPTFALALERGAAPRPPPPSDVDADVDAGVHAGERPANDRRTTGEEEDRSATTFASNDLRLMEEETNARCLSLVPPGDADETLGYQVVRLMQAVDAATERERWGGADDEAAGVRQTRRGRERRKELPPLL